MTALLDPHVNSPRTSLNGRLVVFADDWGRHPSSCQHLVRHLLHDCDVSWINTIGTRRPEFNLATLRRGIEKLLSWRRHPASGPAQGGPRIGSPLMYPGFRASWQQELNARLIARFLRRQLGDLTDATVLTTISVVSDVIDRIPAKRWVYYCVDDFSAWPGLDSTPLRAMERQLVAKADAIVAAGDNLADRMKTLGRNATVITHGIDLAHWSQSVQPHPDLRDLPRPVCLFWGLIDPRLNATWLRALNDRLPSGTIALVGPEQNPSPELNGLTRLSRLGPRAYYELPSLAAAADVLIMPYDDLPVTRAMQPLKLKEYLATGKPVVASDLPSVRAWHDCLDATRSADEFVTAVLARSKCPAPESQLSARSRLQDESWLAKAAQLRHILFGD